ncbi:hypothetical protein TrVFT333_009254 [Trichoderma virens FT-333]|nr:hypothetical protein TrVFT333_009254 [Trichoderma virens FT-333]
MKTAAFIAVALSGLALAAPSFKRTGTEWKDLTDLKYANSVPVSIAKGDRAAVKRAAADVPVKDLRNLKHNHILFTPAHRAVDMIGRRRLYILLSAMISMR